MYAVLRRNNSHPIMNSFCAILDKNTRLWVSADGMHSTLLHDDVIVLSYRNNVQIGEPTRAVLHVISQLFQIVSEHHVSHADRGLPVIIKTSKSDRDSIIFKHVTSHPAENVMDDWTPMGLFHFVYLSFQARRSLNQYGLVSYLEVSPLSIHKIFVSLYLLPKKILIITVKHTVG